MSVRMTHHQAAWFIEQARTVPELVELIDYGTHEVTRNSPHLKDYEVEQEVARIIVECEQEEVPPLVGESEAARVVRVLWRKIQTGEWEPQSDFDPMADSIARNYVPHDPLTRESEINSDITVITGPNQTIIDTRDAS